MPLYYKRSRFMDYELELLNVEKDLIDDPNNAALLELKSDLLEMLSVTKGHSKSIQKYEVKSKCGAKDLDGHFYKAIITNIFENIYTVQFDGTTELRNLKLQDLCPLSNDIKKKGIKSNEYLKRKKENRKLRIQEKIKEESKEHIKSQKNWQKFKKNPKKLDKLDKVVGNGSLNRLH
eukprot:NODE_867_length_3409_cov_0.292447.p3 type:complete len:177 gc:universal NODE_867_length_3409_cov_0.292447:2830-2300(-)